MLGRPEELYCLELKLQISKYKCKAELRSKVTVLLDWRDNFVVFSITDGFFILSFYYVSRNNSFVISDILHISSYINQEDG